MQWSPQQDEALRAAGAWLRDPNAKQVFRLFGWAGTGKSTLARHLAESAKRVRYAAFTGKAALVMRRNGCAEAGTIHSLIYSPPPEGSEDPSFMLNPDSAAAIADLIVVHEVSMVDAELGRDLLSFGKKVLVLGDPFQLPPVRRETDPGEGFFTADKPDVMLTEIHRQAADNPIIRLSMDVREGGKLQRGSYGTSRVISRSDLDPGEVMRADQVLVGRNATRTTYNARMRVLKGYTDPRPAKDDRVICLRNNKIKRLLNGQQFRVTAFQPIANAGAMNLRIVPEDSDRPTETKVKTHQAFFDGVEMPYGERRNYEEFTFGYALTVHKAQGSQWNNVMLFDEGSVFREDASRWRYTAVTRAAERITVVT